MPAFWKIHLWRQRTLPQSLNQMQLMTRTSAVLPVLCRLTVNLYFTSLIAVAHYFYTFTQSSVARDIVFLFLLIRPSVCAYRNSVNTS